jgi:hypothetical protein
MAEQKKLAVIDGNTYKERRESLFLTFEGSGW